MVLKKNKSLSRRRVRNKGIVRSNRRSNRRNSRRSNRRSNKLFTLKKGDLKPYGYSNILTKGPRSRHIALGKAVRDIGKPLSIFRKLIALSTLNKNKNPKLSKIFKEDAYWLREKYM
jgi:hypothetical protein